MGNYFKPWRRKIGVVTLVMALVFMAGWLRSAYYWEGVCWGIKGFGVGVVSLDHMFLISIGAVWEPSEWPWPDLFSFPGSTWEKEVTQKYDYKWTMAGIFLGVWPETPQFPKSYVAAPSYHWIVISLTLISAYLLLIKPRKANQMKITKPTPENVS